MNGSWRPTPRRSGKSRRGASGGGRSMAHSPRTTRRATTSSTCCRRSPVTGGGLLDGSRMNRRQRPMPRTRAMIRWRATWLALGPAWARARNGARLREFRDLAGGGPSLMLAPPPNRPCPDRSIAHNHPPMTVRGRRDRRGRFPTRPDCLPLSPLEENGFTSGAAPHPTSHCVWLAA